jgi:hypothetical protein
MVFQLKMYVGDSVADPGWFIPDPTVHKNRDEK